MLTPTTLPTVDRPFLCDARRSQLHAPRHGRSTLLLLTACIGTLILATSASAASYPGQRPAGHLVRSAAAVGTAFWQARSVNPCPQPMILVADDLTDTDGTAHGRASEDDCALWVLRGDVLDARWELQPRHGGDALETLCTTITHELGHLAGLEHTARGVMAADMPATPYDCQRWAHRVSR